MFALGTQPPCCKEAQATCRGPVSSQHQLPDMWVKNFQLRLQTSGASLHCTLPQFLLHRIHKQKKSFFQATMFWGNDTFQLRWKREDGLDQTFNLFSNNSFLNFSMRYVWHCLYHLFLDFLFLHRSISFLLPFFPSSLLRGLHFLWINRFWCCSTLPFWGLECIDCIHLLFFLGLWLQ